LKPRPFLQGAGLATLYITLYAADFLNSTLGDAYHRFFPLTTIYRAIFLMTLLLWLSGGLAFFVLEGLPLWRKRILWILPIVVLPWLFFRSMSAAFFEFPRMAIATLGLEHALTRAVAVVALSLLLVALRSPVASRIYDGWIRGTRICYMVAGFGLCMILPKIGLHALKSVPPERSGFQHDGLPAVSPSAPRIVWVLMDELSYDQTFASRQPDVQLPNFDRLAQSSILFSDLQPDGGETEKVVPSLLLGRPIVELHKPYPGPPRYRSAPDGEWQRFNERDTIFAAAHSLGWTTGVAGWYNPYCRLLSDVLDRCVWVYSEPIHTDLSGVLSTRNSILQNMWAMMPLRDKLNSLIHKSTNQAIQTHMDDYVSIMADAKDLIQDSRIRFAFIHLPIPHPPGIYDRVHHRICEHGTYLDNLVLADQSLAALQDAIQSTPAAASTTLIVSSDHSWRTVMWRPQPDWTEQEERATHGGQFDQHPVLIVHLPGQDGRQIIAKPVNLLIAHDILEALLRGQINTMADINTLTDRQPQETESAQSGN
jgi:Sulfatase